MFQRWDAYKAKLPLIWRIAIEVLELILFLIVLSIIVRQGIFERRYIPSKSMQPTLQVGDQLIVEKITMNLHKIHLADDFKRGEVVVFYPPHINLKYDPVHFFARISGISKDVTLGNLKPFPFMPEVEQTFIKRIIGLPGETIEIHGGDGVYINGQKLLEKTNRGTGDMEKRYIELDNYPYEPPMASLTKMKHIRAYWGTDSEEPIVIPSNHYFVMGDNRNNSEDSRFIGFIHRDRIVGKAWGIVWRDLNLYHPQLESDVL